MYDKTVYCRVTAADYDRLVKLCKNRGEDPSDFVRRAIKYEFARLGVATPEEKQALGIKNFLEAKRI